MQLGEVLAEMIRYGDIEQARGPRNGPTNLGNMMV